MLGSRHSCIALTGIALMMVLFGACRANYQFNPREDEDPPPIICTVGSPSVWEGHGPATSVMTFTLTLSRLPGPGHDITIDWSTLAGTAEDETGNHDYDSTSGSLAFTSSGSLSKTVDVVIYGDTVYEQDKFLDLILSTSAGIILPTAVRGHIRNDEPLPGVSVDSPGITEGDGGTAQLDFQVSVSGWSEQPLSFSYTTADGTAEDGSGDNDYIQNSGAIVINNGDALDHTVSVTVNGDAVFEADETFSLFLNSPNNCQIITSFGTGTIVNDDVNFICRVDPTSDGGTEDGLTWATAFHTVQTAISETVLQGGGEVWVAAATYINTGGTEPVLTMQPFVFLYGGFEGYAAGVGAMETDRAQRDPETHLSILDGEDRAYHVVVGCNTAVLDGFTVARGKTLDNLYTNDHYGGGMFNDGVSPQIENCVFLNNISYGGGGAIYNKNGAAPSISACTFTGNEGEIGGAICLNNTSLGLSDCEFSGNLTRNSGYGASIGLFNTSSIDVSNCTFNDNSGSHGGAIGLVGSTADVQDCAVTASLTASGGVYGGFYLRDASSLDIRRTRMLGDWKNSGIYSDNGDTVTVTNCVFGGRRTAINVNASNVSIDGCTFYYNDWPLDIDAASITVDNTIIWTGNGQDISWNQAAPVFTNCNVGQSGGSSSWDTSLGIDGGGNIDVNPMFICPKGPDGAYGSEDDDVRLLESSPCVNAGSVIGLPLTDIDGNPRPLGSSVDIGAYEAPVTHVPRRLYVNDDAAGAGNGLTWSDAFPTLREAQAAALSGDEIWVAEGTYTPNGLNDFMLSIPENTRVYGGFAGTETDLAQRGAPQDHPTVLNGEGTCRHILVGGFNSRLDGFSIERGWVQGNDDTVLFRSDTGAGLTTPATHISHDVHNCIFRDNRAGDGGAVWGNGVFENCQFINNFGNGSGGAIKGFDAIAVKDCLFINNTTNNWDGGAIAAGTGPVTAINSVFIGNYSDGDGGGISRAYDPGESPSLLINCTFFKNRGTSGDAVFETRNLTAVNCIFWRNTPGPGLTGGGTFINCNIDGSGGSSSWNSALGTDGGGNIDADPMFIHPFGPDLTVGTIDDDIRLMAGSPCVDAGEPSGAPTEDIAGNPRPLGGGTDIGAYEDPVTHVPVRIFIDPAATGSGDGLSWFNACTSLESGVGRAKSTDEVWIIDTTFARTGAERHLIQIPPHVRIYGGFQGFENNLSERGNPLDHPTILDAQGCNHGVVAENDTRLDGFRIRNGNAVPYFGSDLDQHGGGLLAHNVALDIANCIFENNRAKKAGGAVYASFSEVRLTTSVFKSNFTESGGAGIYLTDSTGEISNCLFYANRAWTSGGGTGLSDSPTTVSNCTFAFNSVYGSGGGIASDSSPVDIRNSIFSMHWADLIPGQDACADAANFVLSYCRTDNTIPGTGNITATPLFAKLPALVRWTRFICTQDTVHFVNAGTYFAVDDKIEINMDGVERTITQIDDETITFSPPLAAPPPTVYNCVVNWSASPPADFTWDLRLQPGSPCIDAGGNSLIPFDILDLDYDWDDLERVPYDLDQNPRTVDDPAVIDTGSGTAPIVDMGAYEKQ